MTAISSPGTPDTGAAASPTLDPQGLVAGMVEALGLVGKSDALIRHALDQRRVSVGRAVKAMSLMGLGFTQRALSLTPPFCAAKPVERLLGAGVAARHLKAAAVGRALDALPASGVEWFDSLLAGGGVKPLGLSGAGGPLEATRFQVDGAYNHSDEGVAAGVVHLRPGYRRDPRPDRNPGVLPWVTETPAGIPRLLAASSGTTNDQTGFRALVHRQLEPLKVEVGLQSWVADSALYRDGSLQALGDMVWLSRVPDTFGAARALSDAVADDRAASPAETSYRAGGGVAAGGRQRGLVVYSRAARLQAAATLRRPHATPGAIDLQGVDRLRRQRFACEADAHAALEAFAQALTLPAVQAGGIVPPTQPARKGRPAQHHAPDAVRYAVEGPLASRSDGHARRWQRNSCFSGATHHPGGAGLDDEHAIAAYRKDPHKVARGFRFLKAPLFRASTRCLQSPARLMALRAIMPLCRLVSAALDYRIRQGLAQQPLTFPDQKGKPTQQPTARWVFLFCAGLQLLTLPALAQGVLNLTPHPRVLRAVLGERYLSLYANSG